MSNLNKSTCNNENSVDNNNNDNYLKFGMLNIHSIRHKFSIITEILDEHQLDLFFITETWLHSSETSIVKSALPKNYNLYHIPRSSNPQERGGGVAVIFKTSFSNFKLLPTFHSTESFEALAFSICYGKVNFNIAVIYRPGHVGTDLFFL